MKEINPDQYLTVKQDVFSAEIKEKGSRFIAQLTHAENKATAEDFYTRVKKDFYDATHNCLAYIITDDIFRYSDDGEPSGTAGLPMFKILQNKNLYQVVVVVTRYFGGTKLGTGGLARAYSDAVVQAVEKSKIIIKTRYITIDVNIKYDKYNNLLKLINQVDGKQGTADFGEIVKIEVMIPRSKFDFFQSEFENNFLWQKS